MTDALPRVLVVAGPTASGKSAFAAALAEKFNGVVINADSLQCYRDLSILTARPTAADEARVSHRLYGFLGPKDTSSAAQWAEMAAREISGVHEDGHLPILVGGTGLYLMALLEGLADVPAIPDDIRTEARSMTERLGAPYMHRMLAERDPETALRLSVNDPQRIARAWEVLEATGQSITWWQTQPRRPAVDVDAFKLLLSPEREPLYDACNRRFDAMLAAGASDQVSELLSRGIDDQAPVMRALGAKELAAYVLGGSNREHAVEAAKAATRHYAKRQSTWFRHQFNAQEAISAQFYESKLQEIFNKIDGYLLTKTQGRD